MPLSLRVAVALIACTTAAPIAAAAAPPRVMYNRALEREEALRPALAASQVSAATISQARKIIEAYERVVARYPASGYSDNALWQAARLAADVWAQTGKDTDRVRATELYKRLIAGYSSSSLVAQARPELARLQRAKVAAVKAAPAQAAATREDRVIPVPPPTPVRARDVPPLPAPIIAPAATERNTAPDDRATISDVKRVAMAGAVRVTIELDREVSYHEERIGNPDRVFLDLRGTGPRPGLRATQTFKDGAVRQIRIGQRPDDSTRVVLEVDGATRHSVFALYNPYRLVIDCELPGSKAVPSTPGVEVLPAVTQVPMTAPSQAADSTPTSTAGASHDAPSSRARTSDKAGSAARSQRPLPPRNTDAITDAVAGAPTGTPSVNLEGRFSLSRQLGLGIARVVIDPGHGGHDPGAHVKDLNEADLVLDVALRLEQLLLKQPGVEVVLTRRTDVFIPLEERTEIANREEADLFLSIHANASRTTKPTPPGECWRFQN